MVKTRQCERGSPLLFDREEGRVRSRTAVMAFAFAFPAHERIIPYLNPLPLPKEEANSLAPHTPSETLVAEHGRAQVVQYTIDWIGNSVRAAAREKQADRAWIGCDIFHH
jgi:hypothetical protein